MALSGIQIYKFLPKTNCKKCGFPTCLAFAMKLSQRAVELTLCPDVTAEAKSALDAASRPPIRLVTIGADPKKISVGNEVVMFRHEKTFYHPSGVVLQVSDKDPLDKNLKLVEDAANYKVERVGMQMGVDGIAIDNMSGNAAEFLKLVDAVMAKTDLPLILMAESPDTMAKALEKAAKRVPLIYAAGKATIEPMAKLAAQHKCPLAVYSNEGLDALAALVEAANKAGVEDIVLDPGARGFSDSLNLFTELRRLALKANFTLLGYPIIAFPGQNAKSEDEEVMLAGLQIAKYAGIVVLKHFAPEIVYPLVTLRMNIYTDPQKPIQVQPGIYPINNPKPESPLLVTTNFSLTYFSCAGEVEASRFPAWLTVCDTEGLSVLTAWAAGKFDAEKIAKTVKNLKVEEKINHKTLVLPGKVAVLRGELEEELAGWKILVGPPEAMEIGPYLKRTWV